MLRTLAFVGLSLLSLAGFAAERPNILFIITDDQRYDALGVVQKELGEAARFPWIATPNLDRLAAEGTRFRNAFVTYSLCSPSRAVFLSGRYNHVNSITDNRTPLPDNLPTYASLLGDAGYSTGYVGKWHMGSQEDRPGFAWSASFTGQGRYMNCPFLVNGERQESTGWVDDVSTDYALDFLKRQSADKPFCLVVGYKTAHGPRTPASLPDRLKEIYADVAIKPAVNADARPPYLKEGDEIVPRTRQQRRRGVNNLNSPVYFQLIKGIDENVGRLLDLLDDSGRSQDTIVVFTSDNGYFLGDHGIGDKRAAYDESLRIPLLIRMPGGKQGIIVEEMALNIDLAPTLLELAGVPVPGSMQGRSLKPLLAGEAPADWRTSFFYEYFAEARFKVPTNFALRTTTAKLVVYPGHDEWTELFNLKADPYEMHNLANDPQHVKMRQRMQTELERQAKSLELPLPLPAEPPGRAP